MTAFEGFSTDQLVPLPAAFFTEVLPHITNQAELRVTLHVFWLLSQQRGRAKRIAWGELVSDGVLQRSLRAVSPLRQPLELLEEGIGLAVERGTLLHVTSDAAGRVENWYLVNTAANRSWAERQSGVSLDRPERMSHDMDSVFAVYQQNIGVLTPMLIEDLREASERFPHEWISAAIREAVEANIRNWRYVRRILERWEADGRQIAPHRSEQPFDLAKYTTGKYAAFFGAQSDDE